MTLAKPLGALRADGSLSADGTARATITGSLRSPKERRRP
jgi:hypothetical protein